MAVRSTARSPRRHLAVVLVTAVFFVASAVTPATASGSEQGWKSCSYGTVALRAETTGVTKFFVPNDASWDKRVNHGGILRTSYYVSGYSSSSWKVTTTGYLYGPGTYAYCSGV